MWLDLLPILGAMMISPARTLAVIVLLHTPRSTTAALAYVGGMVFAMLVQGAGLGVLMSFVSLTIDGGLSAVVGLLFVVGGVVMLASSLRIALSPAGGGSLGSLLDRLERLGPTDAYKFGFGWIFASPKQWVLVMTAVAVIFAADLRVVASLTTFIIFTTLVQLAYFLIIGGFAVSRERVDPVLDATFSWIRGHLRPSAVILFGAFGFIFLLKGVSFLT